MGVEHHVELTGTSPSGSGSTIRGMDEPCPGETAGILVGEDGTETSHRTRLNPGSIAVAPLPNGLKHLHEDTGARHQGEALILWSCKVIKHECEAHWKGNQRTVLTSI